MNWAYGGSSYDLGYNLETGLLVEEATTNVFTSDISTGGDTNGNANSFSINGTGTTVSYTTLQSFQGNGCIKCITPGNVVGEGLKPVSITVVQGSTYTYSLRVLAPLGSPMQLFSELGTTKFTGTGNWQYVTLIGTTTNTAGSYYIMTTGIAQAITFYVDMLQLEAKAYPTSWTLGGTTRSAVSCSIPSNTLNIDTNGCFNHLSANQSNIETDLTGLTTQGTGVTLTRDTTTFNEGIASAKLVCDGSVNNQGIWLGYYSITGGTVHTPFTASLYVNAPLNSNLTLKIYEYDSNSSWLRDTNTTIVTGTGTWQRVSVSGTTGSSCAEIAMGLRTNGLQSITFNVDQLQLEGGLTLHNWIKGLTQVNQGKGTIEFQAYISSSNITSNPLFIPICHNTTYDIADSICVVFQNGTYKIAAWTGDPYSESYQNVSTTLTVGWHKFAITWDISSFKVYMDGNLLTTTNNPVLPENYGNFFIGRLANGGYYWLDSLIRNVCVSNTKRTDSDISNRATNGYTVDNHVTFSAGLTSDLSDILQVILSDGNQAWTDNPQVSVKPTVTDSNKAFVDSISVGSKFTISDSDKSWLDSLLVKNKLTIADNDLSWLDTLLVKSKVSISNANSLWNEIISIASKLKITDSDLAWSDILTIKNKFSIPDNDLNWVDLITLKILSAISDSNFLWQDNLLIKVAFMLADGNCCLDTVENISIASSLTIPDAGEMSETLSVLIQFIINQSGTVEDIVDILNKFTLFDIGQATDLPVVQGKISLQDSGTDIENVLMKSTLSLNDLGFLRDIVNLNNLFTLYDSGIIKEKLLFLIGLLIEDDATDSEAISLLSSLLIKDFGYSVDNAVVNTTLTINDIGVTIEQAIVQVGVLLVDEGYGLDEIVKIFLTEYYDLIVTLEKEYDVIVNVEDIFDAIITYSKQANAKVIK